MQPLTWYFEQYEQARKKVDIMECTQGPGDVFFIPKVWVHMTINLSDTICVATEFLNHKAYELELYAYSHYRQNSQRKIEGYRHPLLHEIDEAYSGGDMRDDGNYGKL